MNATQRNGLLAMIILATGGLTYMQYQSYASARTDLALANATLAETAARAAELPAEQARVPVLNDSLDALTRVLPPREGFSSLLRELRVTAAAHGQTLSPISRGIENSPYPGITAIHLGLSTHGPYPGLQAFLDELHDTTRALTVRSGSIHSAAGGVDAGLELIAYARNTPSAPAPQATP